MKKKLYVFDFDGTLVDTNEAIADCLEHAVRAFYPVPRRRMLNLSGVSLEDSFRYLTGTTDPERLAEMTRLFQEKSAEIMTAKTKWYPGTPEALRKMKNRGAKLAIYSKKNDDKIEDFLSKAGAEDLFSSVTGTTPDGRTPNLLEALEAFKESPDGFPVRPEETAFVGDHPLNQIAAWDAGVDFYAFKNQYNNQFDFFEGTRFVTSIDQLP